MGVRGEEVSALRMRPEGPISKGCSHPPLPRVQLDGTGQERSGPGRRLPPLVLLPLFVEVSEAIPWEQEAGPHLPIPPTRDTENAAASGLLWLWNTFPLLLEVTLFAVRSEACVPRAVAP